MNPGVQYYRAPFPEQKYWKADLKSSKDTGLNTVQLWILWTWVKATPGRFVFEDHDWRRKLAVKNGLGVILRTIAGIQPCWIHREAPDKEIINQAGYKVVSFNWGECHSGLTSGRCTDYPGIWERMGDFFDADSGAVSRFFGLLGRCLSGEGDFGFQKFVRACVFSSGWRPGIKMRHFGDALYLFTSSLASPMERD